MYESDEDYKMGKFNCSFETFQNMREEMDKYKEISKQQKYALESILKVIEQIQNEESVEEAIEIIKTFASDTLEGVATL